MTNIFLGLKLKDIKPVGNIDQETLDLINDKEKPILTKTEFSVLMGSDYKDYQWHNEYLDFKGV